MTCCKFIGCPILNGRADKPKSAQEQELQAVRLHLDISQELRAALQHPRQVRGEGTIIRAHLDFGCIKLGGDQPFSEIRNETVQWPERVVDDYLEVYCMQQQWHSPLRSRHHHVDLSEMISDVSGASETRLYLQQKDLILLDCSLIDFQAQSCSTPMYDSSA